jgi:uncharacterized protein
MKERKPLGLTFPCTFPVKAIGVHSEDFAANVIAIIRRHAPDLRDEAVTRRNSGGGRYLAVTATIIATSQEQLDSLYLDLNHFDQVVMVL